MKTQKKFGEQAYIPQFLLCFFPEFDAPLDCHPKFIVALVSTLLCTLLTWLPLPYDVN